MDTDLPRFGYRYRVVLAEDVGRQPMLSNAEMLIKWGRTPVPIEDFERLRRFWSAATAVNWAQATNGALGPKCKAYVCRLILEGVLRLDLCAQLLPQTMLLWDDSADRTGA